MRWPPVVVLVGALLLLQASVPAQTTTGAAGRPVPLRESAARGVVTDAASGRPLPRALVSVSLAANPVEPVLTDAQGTFVITIPAGGTPRLRVSKSGYTPMLVPFRIDAGLQIPLTRAASISGRVITPTGMPAASVMVLAQRDPSAPASSMPSQASAATNARGEYRIFGLAPGRYSLRAVQGPTAPSVGDARRRPFLEELRDGSLDYDFTSLSAATMVDVAPGAAFENHDLQLVQRRQCALRVMLERRIAPGTARLEGGVLGPSGPLDCVEVILMQAGTGATLNTATDAAGRFTFDRLAAGTYTVKAGGLGYTAAGTSYATRAFGETAQQPPNLLVLRDGDTRSDLTLTLPLAGLIAGIVRDEHGEPLENVSVSALEVRHQDGRDVALTEGALPGVTDDRGYFQVAVGRSGSYILRAGTRRGARGDPPAGRETPTIYFPGTVNAAQADRIQFDGESDVSGLQFTLTPQAGAAISGTALRGDGQPLYGTVRLLTDQRAGTLILAPRATTPDSKGQFRFADVPAGDYVIQARGTGTAGDFGLERVHAVAGEVTRVTVTARPPSTIEGRVVVDGPQNERLTQFALVAVNDDFDYLTMNTIRMRVNADGTVRGNGLSGPMTFALDGAPAGWYLKSFFIDGIDATRVPFDFGSTGRPYRDVEAAISNATGTVTGRAVDRNGIGVNDYAAIVFSVDSADWFSASRLALARAEGDGGFQVRGLPPGDYWIAAIAQTDVTVTNGEWRRRDALARLMPSAQRVTVTSHQTVSATVRLVR